MATAVTVCEGAWQAPIKATFLAPREVRYAVRAERRIRQGRMPMIGADRLRQRPDARLLSSSANVASASGNDSLEAAYAAFAPELLRFVTARLRDPAAAEDLVQEAFIRLAVESQAWREPRNQRAWLYRVVLNLLISGARRAVVARRRSMEIARPEVTDESPEVCFVASERNADLRAAMHAAGPAGRTGLILAAQGYSGREIAQLLGRSEGATRVLIYRARRNVRRELMSQEAANPIGDRQVSPASNSHGGLPESRLPLSSKRHTTAVACSHA